MCSLARVDACYEYHVWLFCVCFFFSLSLSLYERDPTFFLLFFFSCFRTLSALCACQSVFPLFWSFSYFAFLARLFFGRRFSDFLFIISTAP